MQTFDDYAKTAGLRLLGGQAMRSIYYADGIHVWRFDQEWPVSLMTTYLDLLLAAQQWINIKMPLYRFVRIDQPRHVGADFFVLEKHLYLVSTFTYTDTELRSPPDVPPELEEMRTWFRTTARDAEDGRDVLMASVLSRSLIEPNSKTFWDEETEKFIVRELEVTRFEVELWRDHPRWHARR